MINTRALRLNVQMLLHGQQHVQCPHIFHCCCSVSQFCHMTLCDPVDCGAPGFPVLHYLPELAQTHVN